MLGSGSGPAGPNDKSEKSNGQLELSLTTTYIGQGVSVGVAASMTEGREIESVILDCRQLERFPSAYTFWCSPSVLP